MAGVPGRPDAHRARAGDPVPRARCSSTSGCSRTACSSPTSWSRWAPTITICDPHRAIVVGPRRLRGERVESPDIRAGMAMLIAALCAEGTQRDRQHPPDRPRLRAHRRAPARARRADRARGDAAVRAAAPASGPMIHPIPSGTRDVLPDEMRELRAITDAHARRVRARRLRRGLHAGARVRDGAAPRRRRRAARPTGVFDEHGNVLVLRSDMTVPIARRGGDPLPDGRAAAALLLLRPRLPRRARRSAASRASSCRPGSSCRRARRREGTAEALTVLCARARRGRPARATASAWATRRCIRALLDGARRRRRAPRAAPARARRRATSSGSSARCASSASAPTTPSCSSRVPQLRGGAEVLEAPPGRSPTRSRPARGATTLLAPARRRAGDLRPRPGARASATTRARCSRSTTRRSASPLGGGGRYDDLLGRFGRAAAGGAASRSTSSACTSRWPGRSAVNR